MVADIGPEDIVENESPLDVIVAGSVKKLIAKYEQLVKAGGNDKRLSVDDILIDNEDNQTANLASESKLSHADANSIIEGTKKGGISKKPKNSKLRVHAVEISSKNDPAKRKQALIDKVVTVEEEFNSKEVDNKELTKSIGQTNKDEIITEALEKTSIKSTEIIQEANKSRTNNEAIRKLKLKEQGASQTDLQSDIAKAYIDKDKGGSSEEVQAKIGRENELKNKGIDIKDEASQDYIQNGDSTPENVKDAIDDKAGRETRKQELEALGIEKYSDPLAKQYIVSKKGGSAKEVQDAINAKKTREQELKDKNIDINDAIAQEYIKDGKYSVDEVEKIIADKHGRANRTEEIKNAGLDTNSTEAQNYIKTGNGSVEHVRKNIEKKKRENLYNQLSADQQKHIQKNDFLNSKEDLEDAIVRADNAIKIEKDNAEKQQRQEALTKLGGVDLSHKIAQEFINENKGGSAADVKKAVIEAKRIENSNEQKKLRRQALTDLGGVDLTHKLAIDFIDENKGGSAADVKNAIDQAKRIAKANEDKKHRQETVGLLAKKYKEDPAIIQYVNDGIGDLDTLKINVDNKLVIDARQAEVDKLYNIYKTNPLFKNYVNNGGDLNALKTQVDAEQLNPTRKAIVLFKSKRGKKSAAQHQKDNQKQLLHLDQMKTKINPDTVIIVENDGKDLDLGALSGNYNYILFTGDHGDLNTDGSLKYFNGVKAEKLEKALKKRNFSTRVAVLDTCNSTAALGLFVDNKIINPGGRILSAMGTNLGYSQIFKDYKKGDTIGQSFQDNFDNIESIGGGNNYNSMTLYVHGTADNPRGTFYYKDYGKAYNQTLAIQQAKNTGLLAPNDSVQRINTMRMSTLGYGIPAKKSPEELKDEFAKHLNFGF
ncbi:MAG: hypothetical protein HRT87_08660 [Legionellales bacterium]|nr:hypothetical protein [Legionellales bacterium]